MRFFHKHFFTVSARICERNWLQYLLLTEPGMDGKDGVSYGIFQNKKQNGPLAH